ncbi:hypothetical protein OROMI_032321 [Orobanche minor]
MKKGPQNCSVCHFSSKLNVPSNVVQRKRVARILVFKIRPSQEILKIRDGTPLEAEGILTYRKSPRNRSVWHFSRKLDVPGNVLQKKTVAPILVSKIRPSQEILKIRDGTPLEAEGILTYRKKPSKPISHLKKFLKFMMVPLWRRKEFCHTEKSPRNRSVWHFSRMLDVPSNVVQKKTVAWILVSRIRPSQEILKIRDGTIWRKFDVPGNVLQKKTVAPILVSKIRPSQEILKIRDGTPLEAEGILTYRKKPSKPISHLKKFLKFVMVPLWRRKEFCHTEKSPRNRSVWHFSRKLDVPSNVVQKKTVAWILVSRIRPSQEILKIRDGTIWRKFDVPGNVLQKKTVAPILVSKIRPSQEILKIRDGTPLEAISRNS